MAQIALLRRELVEERGWVPPERFARLLAVYQALPGPEAHELCVHLGMVRRGRWGGLLAGFGFMAPGLLFVLAVAAAYRVLNLDAPVVAAALAGAQLGVIALVLVAVWRIGRHVIRGAGPAVAAVMAFAVALLLPMPSIAGSAEGAVTSLALFLTGLKGGLLTFGGAYTAIPVVRADTVGPGRLDDPTFLDGLALTNLLPAPLVLFATFAAFQLGGLSGALALTVGMFLPAFAFGLIFFDRLEAVLDNQALHRLLDLVAAVAVGLMAATGVKLLVGQANDAIEFAIVAGGSLALLFLLRGRLAALQILLIAAFSGAILLR